MFTRLFQAGIITLLFYSAGWTAPGDIMSVAIDTTGWRAEIVIEGLATGGTYIDD
jgi:hypothetical protein